MILFVKHDNCMLIFQAHQYSILASVSGCTAISRMINGTQVSEAFTLTPHTHVQSSVYAIRLGGAGACEAVMRLATSYDMSHVTCHMLHVTCCRILYYALYYYQNKMLC